jgi:hypothetical protein
VEVEEEVGLFEASSRALWVCGRDERSWGGICDFVDAAIVVCARAA